MAILSGVNVTEIEPEGRTVTDVNGKTYCGDVIIAADGPQGLGRKLLGGEPGIPSGYAYYRFVINYIIPCGLIPSSDILSNTLTQCCFVCGGRRESPTNQRWFGG